jgi:hypothetical protein
MYPDSHPLTNPSGQQLLGKVARGVLRLSKGDAAVWHHYEVVITEHLDSATQHHRNARLIGKIRHKSHL